MSDSVGVSEYNSYPFSKRCWNFSFNFRFKIHTIVDKTDEQNLRLCTVTVIPSQKAIYFHWLHKKKTYSSFVNTLESPEQKFAFCILALKIILGVLNVKKIIFSFCIISAFLISKLNFS